MQSKVQSKVLLRRVAPIPAQLPGPSCPGPMPHPRQHVVHGGLAQHAQRAQRPHQVGQLLRPERGAVVRQHAPRQLPRQRLALQVAQGCGVRGREGRAGGRAAAVIRGLPGTRLPRPARHRQPACCTLEPGRLPGGSQRAPTHLPGPTACWPGRAGGSWAPARPRAASGGGTRPCASRAWARLCAAAGGWADNGRVQRRCCRAAGCPHRPPPTSAAAPLVVHKCRRRPAASASRPCQAPPAGAHRGRRRAGAAPACPGGAPRWRC